jgi:anti-sigma B factor antagonist
VEFSTNVVPSIRSLRLDGELDVGTVELLSAPLDEAIAAGGPIFIDMSALRFIDSTGIRELVRAAKAIEPRGWCLLLHIDDGPVGRALELVGLKTVPNIHIIDHVEAHTPAMTTS